MQPRRAREDKTADPNKQERQAFCQTMRHQLQLVKTNADYKALSSLIEEEIRRVRWRASGYINIKKEKEMKKPIESRSASTFWYTSCVRKWFTAPHVCVKSPEQNIKRVWRMMQPDAQVQGRIE